MQNLLSGLQIEVKRNKLIAMILGIIGLILNFIGSFGLVIDAFLNLGKPKAIYLPIHKSGKIKKIIRMEKQNNGIFKQVKRTREEINFILSISLLSIGFLLQLLDYFY